MILCLTFFFHKRPVSVDDCRNCVHIITNVLLFQDVDLELSMDISPLSVNICIKSEKCILLHMQIPVNK